ncbi:MAG: hypothetical protein Q8N90_03100, partial [bacterium]|nr:hypothetical protein [bacterium]
MTNIAGDTRHFDRNRQKETNGHCHTYEQQYPFVLRLKWPRLYTRNSVVLKVLFARLYPPGIPHGISNMVTPTAARITQRITPM